MLQLRPNCECCDADLPGDRAGAFICSFECTFCEACAQGRFGGVCPNCGGELVARPTRSAALQTKYPPAERKLVPHPECAA